MSVTLTPKKFTLSVALLAAGLLTQSGQADELAPALVPAPASLSTPAPKNAANSLLVRFLQELMENIRAPKLNISSLEVESDSPNPFQLNNLDATATFALADTLDMSLLNNSAPQTRASTNNFSPSLEIGEKDLMVNATFTQKSPTEPLLVSTKFSKNGAKTKLPITIKLNNIGALEYQLESVTSEGTLLDKNGDFKVVGSCLLYQQSIQLANGSFDPNGDKPLRCDFTVSYDAVTKKPHYKFSLASRN